MGFFKTYFTVFLFTLMVPRLHFIAFIIWGISLEDICNKAQNATILSKEVTIYLHLLLQNQTEQNEKLVSLSIFLGFFLNDFF